MVPSVNARRDGIVVGLIAYVAVAVFYAGFDVLAARGAFFTVSLLGKALFRGLRDPIVLQYPTRLDWMAIFWYNLLHLVVSLAIGLIVARLIEEAERRPAQARAIMVAVALGFVVTVVIVGVLTAPMRALLPWWSIVAANALATAVAGTWLLARHPGLSGRLALK
jgi:hypothetical protein